MNARRLAEFARLSQAAYLDLDTAARRARLDGWVVTRWLDSGGTQGFIAVRAVQSEAVIVFRGTEAHDLRDVRTDLRAHKTEPRRTLGWPQGRVHAGFRAALDEVWPEVLGSLKRLRRARGPLRVWLSGHSLGGALATLAAARCVSLAACEVAGLVTFGCPRVGCPTYARQVTDAIGEDRVSRVVNNGDVVPRLLLMTFAHVAALVYLTRRGALRVAPGFWFVVWDVLLGALSSRMLRPWSWRPDFLADHRVSEYRRHLTALSEAKT